MDNLQVLQIHAWRNWSYQNTFKFRRQRQRQWRTCATKRTPRKSLHPCCVCFTSVFVLCTSYQISQRCFDYNLDKSFLDVTTSASCNLAAADLFPNVAYNTEPASGKFWVTRLLWYLQQMRPHFAAHGRLFDHGAPKFLRVLDR